jgi:hypothetical protein
MAKRKAFLMYAFCFLCATPLSWASEAVSIAWANAHLPRSLPRWGEWTLQLLPAFVIGCLLFAGLLVYLRRRQAVERGLKSHFVRAWPLYFAASIGTALIILLHADSDFWLYGQLVFWVVATAVGGIAIDGFFGGSRVRRRPDPGLTTS